MIIPEIFKYSSLLSIPLFSVIWLWILRKLPNFSFKTQTISKSIHFIENSSDDLVFRSSFILKALLDLIFAVYVVEHFELPYSSLIAIMLIGSAILFGTLAYFVEGKYTVIHRTIVYVSGIFWAVGYILISRLTGDFNFLTFSTILNITILIIAFGSLFRNKTNVIVQILCVSLMYIWMLVFVFQYL